MASDAPVLHLDGQDYPVVLPDDMTLGEQREFEKIADAGIDKIGELDTEYRTGLIVAWMAVSIHRVNGQTPIGQIVKRLDKLTMAELGAVWPQPDGAQNPPLIDASSSGPSASVKPDAQSSEHGSDATHGNGNQNGSGNQDSDNSASDHPISETSPRTS